MPDGTDNPTTTPAPEGTAAVPAQQPPAMTFTPEQIAWIESEKQKSANAAAAAARREAEGKKKPHGETPRTQTPAPETTTTATNDFDQQFEQRLALESLVQGIASAGLNAEQANAVKLFYQAEKPKDVGDWVKQKVSALGFTKPPNPTQPPPVAAPPASPPVAAQPATPQTPIPAPAGSTPPTNSSTDYLRQSADMRNAYLRSKGYSERDWRSPESRKALREVATEFKNAMERVRITGPTE